MYSTVHQENDWINQQARQNCDSSIKKQTENTCYVCCGELVCVLYLLCALCLNPLAVKQPAWLAPNACCRNQHSASHGGAWGWPLRMELDCRYEQGIPTVWESKQWWQKHNRHFCNIWTQPILHQRTHIHTQMSKIITCTMYNQNILLSDPKLKGKTFFQQRHILPKDKLNRKTKKSQHVNRSSSIH